MRKAKSSERRHGNANKSNQTKATTSGSIKILFLPSTKPANAGPPGYPPINVGPAHILAVTTAVRQTEMPDKIRRQGQDEGEKEEITKRCTLETTSGVGRQILSAANSVNTYKNLQISAQLNCVGGQRCKEENTTSITAVRMNNQIEQSKTRDTPCMYMGVQAQRRHLAPRNEQQRELVMVT